MHKNTTIKDNGFTRTLEASSVSSQSERGFTTTSEGQNENLLSFFPSAVGAKSRSGFTLIELLVVIAIIGILAAIVLASLSGARERAQITRMVSDFEQIELAMTMWMDANRQVQWPDEGDYSADNPAGSNISTLMEETSLDQYLSSVPEPPFGSIQYTYDNDGDTFSCGSSPAMGVNIIVHGVEQGITERIQEIVENDNDLDCGKIRWNSAYDGYVVYSLSTDGNL